jgi:hypothetical protein
MLESPVSVLFNTEGVELLVTASQSGSFLDGTQPGVLVMGSSSNGAQFLLLDDTTGAVVITGSVQATLATPTVDQGQAGTIGESWYVSITDGTQVIGGDQSTPIWVSGVVDIINPLTIDGLNFDVDGNLLTAVSGLTFDVDSNLLVALSGVNVFNGALEITGTINTTMTKCPATVVTGAAADTTNYTILAANADRCKAAFFMDGNSIAYIKLGAGASTTSYTVQLRNNAYYETPENYTGQIDVVFNENKPANVLRVTEINEA